MPSLRELQTHFAAALLGAGDEPMGRIGIYRNTVFANYRNALGATYRVVRQLVGAPFFDAAVDAYVLAYPSAGGDLNVYGASFGDFLATYPHAHDLPYLPDVARLEWAIDEAARAAERQGTPEALLATLGAIPADAIAAQRFALDPTCRLVDSAFPVLRIWQVHQSGYDGDMAVAFDAATDHLLVRRERDDVDVERLAPGAFALLRALGGGRDLASALDAAMLAEPAFDLEAALRTCIANGTLSELRGE